MSAVAELLEGDLAALVAGAVGQGDRVVGTAGGDPGIAGTRSSSRSSAFGSGVSRYFMMRRFSFFGRGEAMAISSSAVRDG